MEGLFLYDDSSRTPFLRESLARENLNLVPRTWPVKGSLTSYMGNSHFIVIDSGIDPHIVSEMIRSIWLISHFIPIFILTHDVPQKPKGKWIFYIDAKCPSSLIARSIKETFSKNSEAPALRCIKVYDLQLDLLRREAKREKVIMPLRNKEFALLEFFMMNRGKVLTRDTIIESVWDRNAHFASNTLDVHVNRLRKKIDSHCSLKLIHTVHCIGYRFDRQ